MVVVIATSHLHAISDAQCGELGQASLRKPYDNYDSRQAFDFKAGEAFPRSRAAGLETLLSSPLVGDVDLLRLSLWQQLQNSPLWALPQALSTDLVSMAASVSSNPLSLALSSLAELAVNPTTPSANLGPTSLMDSTPFGLDTGQQEVTEPSPIGSGRNVSDLESARQLDVNPFSAKFDLLSRKAGCTPKSAAPWPTAGATLPKQPADRAVSSTSSAASPGTSATSTTTSSGVSVSLTCYNCGLGTTTRKNLARHIRSCLGYRPHHCPLCPYAASRRDNLRRHLAIHKDAPSLETAAAAALIAASADSVRKSGEAVVDPAGKSAEQDKCPGSTADAE